MNKYLQNAMKKRVYTDKKEEFMYIHSKGEEGRLLNSGCCL